MNDITRLTPAQLRQAADIQERIESLRKELDLVLGAEPVLSASATEAPVPPNGSRQFSAKTRAKMAAAQKARWAAKRGEVEPAVIPPTEPAPTPAKKPVTDAKLKALAKAREARWAKVRAAKEAAVQPGAASKGTPKKKKASGALLKALAKARAARSAKAKAAKDDVPF